MVWEKHSEKYLSKLKSNYSTLTCDASIETGYVRCRGICCDTCDKYNICEYNHKCTIKDLKECLN